MNNKKIYESIYIVKGTLQNKEYKEVLENLKKQFKNLEIEKIKELGIKNLAYEVKNNKTGYYVDIEFLANDKDIKNLELYCRKNENILKWIFVRKD